METPVRCWWECRLVQPLWKTLWRFLKKLKMELPYDPEIALLGMYLKKPKTLIQKNICIPVFIAVLLTIAMLWKQPRCPSVHDWIIKTCGTFTQWDTARPLKKNEILSFQTVWMDLQGITLGEISQRRTNTM